MSPICLVSRAQILTAMSPAAKQKMRLLEQSGVNLEPIPGGQYETFYYTPEYIASRYTAYIEQIWRDDSNIELPGWLKADSPTLAQLPAGFTVHNWPVRAGSEVAPCTH